MKFENLNQLNEQVQTLDEAELRQVEVSSSSMQNYVAIWNTSKDQLETITDRKTSCLIQHREAFSNFVTACEVNNIKTTGQIINFGGHVIVEAIFENVNIFDDDNEQSAIKLGVRLENNYDDYGKPSFKGEAFGMRDVCQNGMIIGGTVANMKLQHNKIADIDKGMQELLLNVMNNKDKIKQVITNAKNDVITDVEDVMKIMKGYIESKRKVRNIRKLFEDEDVTRYTIYNSITNYATHESKEEKEKKYLQHAAQRILLTPKADLNRGDWSSE